MIDPKAFYSTLKNNDINFFTGVPDSLLKDFLLCLSHLESDNSHVITHNEGGALALAAGHQLSTGKIPCVYLQNSGIGNLINPLLSLMDSYVYSIPALIITGWRGEPSSHDEPQHKKQGLIHQELLKAIDYENFIIDSETSEWSKVVSDAINLAKSKSKPVFISIKSDTFLKYESQSSDELETMLPLREEAISVIAQSLNSNDIVISSTGKISRELYEHRINNNQPASDFYTVGSMGHSSMIALGISLNRDNKRVLCLDGDGSVLMHLGALPIIGTSNSKSFVHVILNNCAHDSVGGQPTIAGQINLTNIAINSGYDKAVKVDSLGELKSLLESSRNGKILIEVMVRKGSRKNLIRPKSSPIENKNQFLMNL